MIVNQINTNNLAVLKMEDHAPIPRNRYRIKPGKISLQPVELKLRNIHIFSNKSGIKQSKNVQQMFNKRLLHILGPVVIIEARQAFVLNTTNYTQYTPLRNGYNILIKNARYHVNRYFCRKLHAFTLVRANENIALFSLAHSVNVGFG
jgi:hypothetical protein